jgi:hypothetical protein
VKPVQPERLVEAVRKAAFQKAVKGQDFFAA